MINGRKGRARELARIRRQRLRKASAAGVDVTDRKALARWESQQLRELCDRIKRNAGKRVEEWS